ncbi:MAG: hypothetical protein MJA82_12475 [Clostridia bacterium]|nr:hypothetical protein [Clostridia bacterium]
MNFKKIFKKELKKHADITINDEELSSPHCFRIFHEKIKECYQNNFLNGYDDLEREKLLVNHKIYMIKDNNMLNIFQDALSFTVFIFLIKSVLQSVLQNDINIFYRYVLFTSATLPILIFSIRRIKKNKYIKGTFYEMCLSTINQLQKMNTES